MQVETPLAGPSNGSTLRMWRSLVHISKLQPTPQYVQTVLVRRIRVFAHGGFGFGNLQHRTDSRFRLHALHDIDHAVEGWLVRPVRKPACAEHGFLHQRVAGANGDAMAAGDAARFADRRAAIPEHARVRVFPADGERFVDFQVLAGFHAAAAKDALVGIVAIERIAVVDLVRLRLERDMLVVDLQQSGGVVDCQLPLLLSQTVQ